MINGQARVRSCFVLIIGRRVINRYFHFSTWPKIKILIVSVAITTGVVFSFFRGGRQTQILLPPVVRVLGRAGGVGGSGGCWGGLESHGIS